MRYPIFLASLSLLASPAAANAAGDCQPVFVNDAQSLTIDGVEIEPGGRSTQDFQVRVQNEAGPPGNTSGPSAPGGAGPCRATIRLARLIPSPDPEFPAYLLRAPGNSRIEILPDPASGGTADSDVVIANAPPGPQGRAVPFQIGVPTEWGLKAGTYSEQLQLLLIDENGNIVDRSTLTITIIIPPAVSLRLVGAIIGGVGNGPAQVDLGVLSSSRETHSQPFGARIFSTAPYVVRFNSANLGHLLHEQGGEEIPYRLFFDGALVDLSGGNSFPYPHHTSASGDSRPMRIVVPPVTALAGRYSDRITVTVTAL